jgi:hypothetical protein
VPIGCKVTANPSSMAIPLLSMSALRLLFVSIFALLVAACVPETGPGDQVSSKKPDTKTYGNPAYGVSFVYPAEYTLREYGTEAATIGTLSGETLFGKVDMEIVRSTDSLEDAEYDMFVANHLRNSCAADGPGGSYACTDVISREPVKTPSGLSADEIYLKSEDRNFDTDETMTDERGPFVVFNLGATVSGSGFTVLIIRPATAVPVSEIDELLVRDIRDSVQLRTVDGAASSVVGSPRSKEGELCGGIAGFLCEDGLVCRYDGDYPDAAGTCAKA